MTPRVLVVDDDAGVRYTLRGILEDAGLSVAEATGGDHALSVLEAADFDLVVSDLRMPGLDGLGLLRALAQTPRPPRFILVTAHGSERAAVEAMKEGAYDYFRKPFDPDELLRVVERAVESVRLKADREQLKAELALSRHLIFASPAMKHLALLTARVAATDATVLITGESGTGKERIAEALVAASRRREGAFVRFNCAAINPQLAESELFGHRKGAFTGADRDRAGFFREADGGTLFLDEVGELDLRTQATLLRVLQERQVRPVGADRSVAVNVRILAATHQDLKKRVEAKTFREDLFYRLKVVHLEVPPLRDRPEDVPVLARHFLRGYADQYGKTDLVLDEGWLTRLASHRWDGNVRELENTLESLVALSPPDRLDAELLRLDAGDRGHATLEERLFAYERGLIREALRAAQGNRTQAAKALGVGRATLYEKLKKHGLGA